MKRNAQQLFLTAFVATAAAFLSAAFSPAFAQANAPEAGRGAPQDWSHRHLLHTSVDTHDEAARKGTLAFEKWKQKNKDPRYAAQAARKARFVQTSAHSPFSPEQLQWANRHRRDPPPAGIPIHRDWSVALGTEGVGHPGVFPAKFGFDTNANPRCADDFVVYTTTGVGAKASMTGTFTGRPNTGGTITIGGTFVLTAGTTNTATTFARSTNTTTQAANLAAAINLGGASVGVSATSASAVVTVTAILPGAGGNSITLADATSGTTFSWAATPMAGGLNPAGSRPTIVAFNNLYSSCAPSTVPSVFWSYNTGAAFTETSPVLSYKGDQVAFIQRTGNTASLVLLKWSTPNGTVAAPSTPTTVITAANYHACTAPCMAVLSLGANNSNSSPFVDYLHDTLYVGDDTGRLHKFTDVFGDIYGVSTGVTTPAEAAPWPVAVSTGNILSSPVYDSGTSGLVFVGSASGPTSGGSLHSVDSTGTIVATSARLATNSSAGISDSPIVDSDAQRVYAFVGSDTGVATTGTCNTIPCAAVFQFTTNLATNTKVRVGRGVRSTTTRILYAGAFDNDYYDYTTGTAASPTGHLYVCGSLAATASRPTLWQIPITNNVMSAGVVGPSLVSNNADCSAVTEVLNDATHEYIYASVTAVGNDTGCTGACIYMFNLIGLTWNTSAVANAGLAAPGGTSGIIIDNTSATTGTSQIYYSTLTSPGNAVQASQAGLN